MHTLWLLFHAQKKKCAYILCCYPFVFFFVVCLFVCLLVCFCCCCSMPLVSSNATCESGLLKKTVECFFTIFFFFRTAIVMSTCAYTCASVPCLFLNNVTRSPTEKKKRNKRGVRTYWLIKRRCAAQLSWGFSSIFLLLILV